MTKIEFGDTTQSMCMKMSERNPGALGVCMDLILNGGNIDTDDIMGGLGSILMLDTLGVYGYRIWMLYKDVCGEELYKMIAVIRANQMGHVNDDTINYAIENRGSGLDVEECVEFVISRLDGFVIPERNRFKIKKLSL